MKISITSDNSHTIVDAARNVSYHSKYGAIQESKHVFITAGLDYVVQEYAKKQVSIFEMGFGTGLNALLSLQFAKQNSININYTAIEAFPLDTEIITQLNYGSQLQLQKEYNKLHTCNWNAKTIIEEVELLKVKSELQTYQPTQQFDIIYYDAFAPTAQPELWTITIFEKLYAWLNNNGVLVTYCSKGDVRRNLLAAGFTIEKLVGPPGKREMLRATKR